MKIRNLLTSLALGCAVLGAQAQKVAPGLWEHSATMKALGGKGAEAMAQMQAQLAQMPPEQRRQMEAMMASQGVTLGAGSAAGQPILVKVCLTPEQAARDALPVADSNCRQTSRERSGNVHKFKFVCTGEREGSGEGEFTMTSDKAYQGRMRMSSKSRGQVETMEIQQSARWLAADCGAVKPRP